MLKNKTEREEYFRDDKHWILLEKWCLHSMFIKVYHLTPYNIIKITADVNLNGITECVLGCYELCNTSEAAALNSIYELTLNQCIDVMTKQDMEEKRCLSH